MTVSEIKYYIKNGGGNQFGHQDEDDDNQVKGNYASLIFTCIIFILLLLFLLLTFISWIRNTDKKDIGDSCKARELYYGIRQVSNKRLHHTQVNEDEANNQGNERIETYKQQNESNENDGHDDARDTNQAHEVSFKIKLARLYYVIFLARRLMLTILVVLIPDSLFALRVVFVLLFQLAYLAYSMLVRSFTAVKDTVVEVCIETFMVVLVAFLIKYPSKSEWTNTAENEFIGIVLSQI